MSLIKPFKQGTQLAEEIEFARRNGSASSLDLWWLGQSGFLVLWDGHSLLLDPYLSDSLTKKYLNTDKPHVRMSELVIHPSLLKNIDVVTSSHNHTDHLDGETLTEIFQVNKDIRFLVPEANRGFVADRLHCKTEWPIGITDGQTRMIEPFSFSGIVSAHNDIERDDVGNCKFMGYVAEFGPFAIYHSGDTLVYDELSSSLKPFDLDIAFLPINGNDPSRRVAGNMNGDEAARLGKEVNAGLVIPHHYHMFEFNTAEPDQFVASCKSLGQEFKVLRLGERFSWRAR